jgi:hypothetical protein
MELRLVSIFCYQILLYGIPQTSIFVQVLQDLSRVSTLEIFLTFNASYRSRLCVHQGCGTSLQECEVHVRHMLCTLRGFLWVYYLLFILTFQIAIYSKIHLFIFCQATVPSSRVTWRCYKYLLN